MRVGLAFSKSLKSTLLCATIRAIKQEFTVSRCVGIRTEILQINAVFDNLISMITVEVY